MFEPSQTPRLFALPPGCDFLPGLVDGLTARLAGSAPEAIARVEVFLNTQRSARKLRDLLTRGHARFLPRIRVITDLANDPLYAPLLPPVAPSIRQRLEVAQTVAALLRTAPDMAPRSSIFSLADSLVALVDEMHTEGVDLDALDTLDVAEHAAHWERSLKFLKLMRPYFDGSTDPGPGARLRKVVTHLSEAWQSAPPRHPIIIAGSTGSRGATALFMELVAGLPQGAVVLPGFDFDLPDNALKTLADPNTIADHPQSGMIALIGNLGLDPAHIENWSGAAPVRPARNRLVSLALRPAPVTDQWLREGPGLGDLAEATDGLSLIEAPSQRAEALAIALVLRSAAEEGTTATLITPDRQLSRLVTTALERWKILPDDSGGTPLPQTPVGIFLRLVARHFSQDLTGESLLKLLKHPLTGFTRATRGPHLLRSRALEIDLLRGGAPYPEFSAIREWARKRQDDPGAPDWAAWLDDCFGQTGDAAEELPFATHVARHLLMAEKLALGPAIGDAPSAVWAGETGETARRLFDSISRNADAGGEMTAAEYSGVFLSLLATEEIRNPERPHPDITIWGTLEARVQNADTVILGGLNEGIWPGMPGADPWLSREMRAQAGLLPPERKIGLSAHDFQQAVAGNRVFLCRSLRDHEAPTIASRWLIRLTNLLSGLDVNGETALSEMRARGQHWLDLAAETDRPKTNLTPARRPSPKPAPSARPNRLSVTQIRTLIRDPYAIYARKILKLWPLDPLVPAADALLRGLAVHSAMERFGQQTLDGLPDNARELLLEIFDGELAESVPFPAARCIWRARLVNAADAFLSEERMRREAGTPDRFEIGASLDLGDPEFRLTGKADRIDRAPDGSLIIYDYKTGAVPTGPQVEHFDKQLPLEAAIAERGGFRGLPATDVSELGYIGLGSAKSRNLGMPEGLAGATLEGLKTLIRAYQNPDLGYTARARMERRTDISDYDHLSRLGEWDDSDPTAVTGAK